MAKHYAPIPHVKVQEIFGGTEVDNSRRAAQQIDGVMVRIYKLEVGRAKYFVSMAENDC